MEEKNEILNNTEDISTPHSEETVLTEEKQNENVISETVEIVEKDVVTKMPHKRILSGKVVSNKPNKTIIVAVISQVMHPLYKKYYKVTKKVMAHDEENSCNEGDIVKIKEHRPLSAKKRWILDEIVQRAK